MGLGLGNGVRIDRNWALIRNQRENSRETVVVSPFSRRSSFAAVALEVREMTGILHSGVCVLQGLPFVLLTWHILICYSFIFFIFIPLESEVSKGDCIRLLCLFYST